MKTKQKTITVLFALGAMMLCTSAFAGENDGKGKKETNPAGYMWANCPLQTTCTKSATADAGPDRYWGTGGCCTPPTLGGTTMQNCATGSQACHPTQQITYAWLPITGLSSSTSCNPTATPATTTTYTLTVTFTCGHILFGGAHYYCCVDGCSGECGASPYCSGTQVRTDVVVVTVNGNACCRLINPDKQPEVINMLTKIYPNPSPGVFTLEIENMKLGTDVNVYNIAGDGVWMEKNISSNKQIIDLTNQGKGVYFIEVKNNEKVSFYKKVIVQ